MAYTERDRIYQQTKAALSTRTVFVVRRSNWIQQGDGKPPLCAIHNEEAMWQRNRARESGGQWTCRTCARLKSKGLRRKWRTEHTDPFHYNLKRAYIAAKSHSKKIGRPFSITFNDVLALWEEQNGRCAISGDAMEYLPGNGTRNRYKVTMDRIDCTGGYEAGNVWLVCDWVNRAKSDLSKAELIRFSHGILRNLSRLS